MVIWSDLENENDGICESFSDCFDIPTEQNIIAVGTLQLWNGYAHGVVEYSNNISECFNVLGRDGYLSLMKDRYNITGAVSHHDGVNTFLFREWKPCVSERQKQNFMQKGRSGKLSNRDISRYTKSIKGYI